MILIKIYWVLFVNEWINNLKIYLVNKFIKNKILKINDGYDIIRHDLII